MINKNLRFAVGLIALTLVSVSSIYAQGNKAGERGQPTPEDRAKRNTEMMKQGLSLTSAQETKVLAINLKYAKKNDEARKITDMETKSKTFMDLNKQKDDEFKAVLTPTQFKTYLKQVEEMKAKRRK